MFSMISRSLFAVLLFSCNCYAKTVITPTDIELVGIFRTPSDISSAHALTHRYIGGTLYLYSLDSDGNTYEWIPPAANTWGSVVSSAPSGTVTNNFGDIFQNALRTVVDNGSSCSPSSPCIGLSGGAKVPDSLFWDDSTGRMYWASVIAYNNTTSTSDTSIGYAVLDDDTHSGTGAASFKVSPPAGIGGDGGRWGFQWTHIPAWFADAYLSGKRLGLGFGGGLSILSNGYMSLGPALWAMNPPDIATDTAYDYLSSSPKKLLSHLANTETRAMRNASYPGLNLRGSSGDGYYGETSYWFSEDKSQFGVWIDTSNKSGLLVFSTMGAGNADTTVSSISSKSTFTVVDKGDIEPGDYIRIYTDYNPNPLYPFEMRYVQSVLGNEITLESALTGNMSIGSIVQSGCWYAGGGNVTSRYWTPLYIYDPSDLADVAQGTLSSNSITPSSNYNFDLPGVFYPIRGTGVGGTPSYFFKGITYDATTQYLYLMSHYQDSVSNIIVYRINDYPGKRYRYLSISGD